MYKNKVKQLIKHKLFRTNIDIDTLSYTQLKYIFLFCRHYFSDENKINKKFQAISNNFYKYIKYGDVTQIIQRHIDSCEKGFTLNKCVAMYGENEGVKRFEAYKEKQAYTNSLEYKSKKYGMTESEFSEYNKLRSNTLENSIARHGESEGIKRFEAYKQRQSYTKSKQRYIDEFGEDEGTSKFHSINSTKSHSFSSYKLKFPDLSDDEIIKKLEHNYKRRSSKFYSLQSQQLFNKLDDYFKNDNTYYAIKNNEFGIYDHASEKYYMYDYCNLDKKFIIEYNGDYYHANPEIYSPDSTIRIRGGTILIAKEVWEKDRIKNEAAERKGFKVVTVWESDFLANLNLLIEDILLYVGD